MHLYRRHLIDVIAVFAALLALDSGAFAGAVMYVSDPQANQIDMYNGMTGTFLSTFASVVS
jgi:hypothetical protein